MSEYIYYDYDPESDEGAQCREPRLESAEKLRSESLAKQFWPGRGDDPRRSTAVINDYVDRNDLQASYDVAVGLIANAALRNNVVGVMQGATLLGSFLTRSGGEGMRRAAGQEIRSEDPARSEASEDSSDGPRPSCRVLHVLRTDDDRA